ncbi:MAG: SPOR domain-containing protein [Rhodobacteraceae bacterium]|nr:SPOR domain-containing protein [Paracoccaceae bacterium]
MLGLLIAGLGAGAGHAQSLRGDDGPAEIPPASFEGRQYVDSQGCVYIRAGYAGQVTWVPRVSRAREVLCGFKPTFADTARAAPVAAPAPGRAQVDVAPVRNTSRSAPVPMPTARSVCPGASAQSARYINDGSQYPVRCGPQAEDPRVQPIPARTPTRITVTPAPAPTELRVPDGYRPVWKDDRLNPMRGQGTARGDAQMAQVWTDSLPRRLVTPRAGRAVAAQPQMVVSTKSVPQKPARAAAPRYVQVGAFGDPANARAAVTRLQRLGLPVRQGQATTQGRALTVIYAGPFSDPDSLGRAHDAIRRAGYPTAFLRK